MKYTALFTSLLLCVESFTQVSDNFSDSTFISNPAWHGDHSGFIINQDEVLQSFASGPGDLKLSTKLDLSNTDTVEWRFQLQLDFSPSSGNFSRVYLLLADSTDLSSNGFYVQFGESGSQDKIRVMEQHNGQVTEIFAGPPGEIASAFKHTYRLIRTPNREWTIWRDDQGGTLFKYLGATSDTKQIFAGHLLWYLKFTSSNTQKFYLDNVYAGKPIIDTIPPAITNLSPRSNQHFLVEFSEPIDSSSFPNMNCKIDGVSKSASILPDSLSDLHYHLHLSTNLPTGFAYHLSLENLTDSSGNPMTFAPYYFSLLQDETPHFGDVIFTEIMADPSPPQSMPNIEYFELFNRSLRFFNLNNWKVADLTDTFALDSLWLMPNKTMVIGPKTIPDSIQGARGILRFPNLNNSGDRLLLLGPNNEIIDSLSYSTSTYLSSEKDKGGFSLVRKDLQITCSDEQNWQACPDPRGGNPGDIKHQSSEQSFQINHIIEQAPNLFELHFNQYLDSTRIPLMELEGSSPSSQIQMPTHYSKALLLEFNQSLSLSTNYPLTINNLPLCDSPLEDIHFSLVRPEKPQNGDLKINEILFYPSLGQKDFIELKNTSRKILDLSECTIDRLHPGEEADKSDLLFSKPLSPLSTVAFCEDTTLIKQAFQTGQLSISNLPAFPSDSGSIALVCDSDTLDIFHYSSDMHYALLDNDRGKSLERLSCAVATNNPFNWHTAAENERFATPGRENSQFNTDNFSNHFELLSNTVSPDGDGYEDLLRVNYTFEEVGYAYKATIYAANGATIYSDNQLHLASKNGLFTWDGLNNWGDKVHIGPYILFIELLHPKRGTTFAYKLPFVVAGKL